MNTLRISLFIILIIKIYVSAQEIEEQAPELFIIDSYVTPEEPNTFYLSFFSTDSCKSRIIIDNKYRYDISDELNIDHTFEQNFSELKFDSLRVQYSIILEDSRGNEYVFDEFDVHLPEAYKLDEDKLPGLITVCCLGGIVFGLPSPALTVIDGKNYFQLSKEIPILSIFSSGYNYPESYLSIEYGYVFNAPFKSLLRGGYKYIWTPGFIEYISPGLNLGINFNGSIFVSPELTIGLFKIYNVFTVNARYRYNLDLNNSSIKFHELSIGLYSNFFSINL